MGSPDNGIGRMDLTPSMGGDPQTELVRNAFSQLSRYIGKIYKTDRLGNFSKKRELMESKKLPLISEEQQELLVSSANALRLAILSGGDRFRVIVDEDNDFLPFSHIFTLKARDIDVLEAETSEKEERGSYYPSVAEVLGIGIKNLALPLDTEAEPLEAEISIGYNLDNEFFYHVEISPVGQNDNLIATFDGDKMQPETIRIDEVQLFGFAFNILKHALVRDALKNRQTPANE